VDQRVYNLTVSDIHTYYVLAGDQPVLVHNCGDEVDNRARPGLLSPDHKAIGDPNAKGGVYALVAPETGRVMRTGMAVNLSSRKSDHKADFPDLEFVPLFRTDSRSERKGLEEMVENWFTPMLRDNRAISLRNGNRPTYIQAARDFLGRHK
jgi:hypothetical protein